MSEIGRPDRDPFGPGGYPSGSDFERGRDAFGADVKVQRDPCSPSPSTDKGRSIPSPSTCAAFQSHLRTAHAADHRETEHDDGERGLAADSQLLAVAEAIMTAGLPSPNDTDTRGPASPAPAAAVARLMDLICQSDRLDLATSAGNATSVHLAFGDGLLGVVGVTIALSATTLDVTLERVDLAQSTELIGAAEALAERLATRYPKQRVRILDAALHAAAASVDAAPGRHATKHG
jgi:hypothetical protein